MNTKKVELQLVDVEPERSESKPFEVELGDWFWVPSTEPSKRCQGKSKKRRVVTVGTTAQARQRDERNATEMTDKCGRCGSELVTDGDTAYRYMMDQCMACADEGLSLLDSLSSAGEEVREVLDVEFIRILKEPDREAYELRTSKGSTLRVERARKGWRWQFTGRGKVLGNGWYEADDRDLARAHAVLTLRSS